jgi:hypothetical protein
MGIQFLNKSALRNLMVALPLTTVATLATPLSIAGAESATVASEPFAFGDFTWMNGNNRQKSSILDSKYFTGQFMADMNYVYSFQQPKDHTLVGSTSSGRTNEFQVQQLGIGGDFHAGHSRGRLMTQFGMYSTMTPRNDASTARGQWNLNDAYRYISEAYGGYHWDVLHGINVDAGLFMSYVGLFSYYNNENWAYQASYTSANTPWYFNGVRVQVFPTEKLKTELWIINGWQSYGQFNEMPGLGAQVNYRWNENNSFISNAYYGVDTLKAVGRNRYHSDSSWQHRYLERPSDFISRAAFSTTFDFGCESGDGVKCFGGDSATEPSQYFMSAMAYNRLWFAENKFAFTLGGGFMSNPGRYLVLLPPIQTTTTGAQGGTSATNNTCSTASGNCFTQNKGDHFNGWDSSLTFDFMPDEFTTFRVEYNHREADVPYFAGRGGVTSADSLNTTPTTGFTPDLVNTEDRINLALMVRF